MISPIHLEGVRKVGDPHDFATRYDREGVDEIIYLDMVASLYGRNALAPLVEETMSDVFCPLTVGGGISSIAHCRDMLRMGGDKLAICTAGNKRPELISELARKFGSQAVVLQLDAKRKGNSWEAYCDGGRQPIGRDAIEWAKEAVDRGAGEILVTSIDRQGTGMGLDLDLVSRVCSAVSVPVVASGGVGKPEHVVQAANVGASGVAMASALHYGRCNLVEIRVALDRAGVPVRMVA